MSLLKVLNRTVFFVLLTIIVISFFARDNYRGIGELDADIFNEPMQSELMGERGTIFTQDEYEYSLEYLYEYEMSALIVSKMDYRWFSISKRDSVFPIDICVIWGENTRQEVFRNKSLHFTQDFRFCNWMYSGRLEVRSDEIANVHLLINNKEIEKRANKLSVGDQVRVKGKLVNVKATNIGEAGKYDPEYFELNSSTGRGDSGAGACEILLVEDIEIIKKGNQIYHVLYRWGGYLLVLLIILNIIYIFADFKHPFYRKQNNLGK